MVEPSSTAASARAPSAAHRADIDGLRGIAVLSVFAVHSIPNALHGGFIGVDVFFVISGYLICLLTLQAQAEQRFSMLAFYARRIKRIVPALLLVLVVCLLFAVTMAFPRETREVGKHVAGGAAFVSNLVLWTEAGYFDQSSEFKPLLHLWSLGIEEQFYLVWPLLALALGRWRQRAALLIMLALVASFALNLALVESKPKGTFFLPVTRFWELLIGVALAHCNHWVDGGPLGWVARRWRLTPPSTLVLINVCSAAGALALGLGVVLIDKNDHFPGAWALLPTLGTAALIAAGPQGWINRRVLSDSVLQFYGRISFSLYLWHWPLLTFPLLLGYRLEWLELVALLGLSVVLAFLTQRWIEAPARHSQRAPFTVPWLLAGLCGVGLAGVALSASDGLLWRYPTPVRPVAMAQGQDDYAHYRVGHCFLRSEQDARGWTEDCIDAAPADGPLVWLWGDSHAAALYPGLRDEQMRAQRRAQTPAQTPAEALAQAQSPTPSPWRLAQTTAALCPPMPGPVRRFSPHCSQNHQRALDLIGQHRPQVVILAGAWTLYRQGEDPDNSALDGLRDTMAQLKSLGVRQIIVVGPLPQWRVPLPGLLLKHWRADGELPATLTEGLLPAPFVLEPPLRTLVEGAGATFYSVQNQWCTEFGCKTTVLNSQGWTALAFDESHLTLAGSRLVAQGLMQAVANASLSR